MNLNDQLISGLLQVLVAILIGFIAYGIRYLFFRQRLGGRSFLNYLGIQSARRQIDNKFLIIWVSVILFAIISTLVGFCSSDSFKAMLMSENSPYGKILKNGFNSEGIVLAFIYCYINSAGAEEILFRGLVAKRMFSMFGFFKGNIIQAFIFWLMHLVIIYLMTKEWCSFLQTFAFISSFGLGLLSGYVNYRKNGESILPSWILHSCANFATFLTLSVIWPN